MVRKLNRADKVSVFLLKLVFIYAKVFNIATFSIQLGDMPKLINSANIKFFSVGFRLVCLIVHAAFLPSVLAKAGNPPTSKRSVDNYLLVILFIQFISIAVFTIALITVHVVGHKRFVRVVNRAIVVFFRISKLTKNEHSFNIDFYMMVLLRLLITSHAIFANIPQLYTGVVTGNYLLAIEWLVEHYLWIGTLIVLDTCFIGYVAFAAMYKNITNYMIEFVRRVESQDLLMHSMNTSCRRRLLHTLSRQLEECTAIYSEIFLMISDFHEMFQFNILYTFYIDLVSVVVLAHYGLWTYLIRGELVLHLFIYGSIKAIEILLLICAADTVVRRSKIAEYLNWDSLCSDIDKRWDRAAYTFLNLLRFQDLKFEIYGLFRLDNQFCLHVLSAIIAYLTVLLQFGFLGYFSEEDYVFKENEN